MKKESTFLNLINFCISYALIKKYLRLNHELKKIINNKI